MSHHHHQPSDICQNNNTMWYNVSTIGHLFMLTHFVRTYFILKTYHPPKIMIFFLMLTMFSIFKGKESLYQKSIKYKSICIEEGVGCHEMWNGRLRSLNYPSHLFNCRYSKTRIKIFRLFTIWLSLDKCSVFNYHYYLTALLQNTIKSNIYTYYCSLILPSKKFDIFPISC
jgi:hypothetical protein